MTDSEAIMISCPACQAGYELTAANVGEQVECVCGHQFIVPEQPPQLVNVLCPTCAAVYELEPSVLGEDVECQCGAVFKATETAMPSDTVESKIRTLCPSCSSEYELEAEAIGEQVECGCGVQFTVEAIPRNDEVAPITEVAKAEDEVPQVDAGAAVPELEPYVEPTEYSSDSSAKPSPVDEDDKLADLDEADESPASADAADEPATGNTATETKKTTRGSTSKHVPARRKKKSSANLMIMGGCGIGAVALILVFMFAGGDEPPEPTNTQVAQSKDAPARNDSPEETVVADSQPTESNRLTLAQRLAAAKTGNQVESPDDGTDSQPHQVATTDTEPPSTKPISENPNTLTKKDDFVIGGGPSKANNTPPRPAPANPKVEKPTETAVAKADIAEASATAEDNAELEVSKPEPPKLSRISFIAPKRRYSRFKDAAIAGFKQFNTMREKKAATSSGDTADIEAWKTEVAGTGGVLQKSLELVDEDSDPKMVLQARLIMAYCYLEAGQLYEAGILAHALVRWTPADLIIEPEKKEEKEPKKTPAKKPTGTKNLSAGEAILAAENAAAAQAKKESVSANVDPGVPMQPALEAATLALAAFVQAHDTAPEDDRDAEFKEIVKLALLFQTNYPKHEKADSIRLFTGQLHQQRNKHVGAAQWYARVSKASPEYARSRLQAGQTLWTNYLASQNNEAVTNTKITPEQLKQRVQQYLTTGVEAGADNASLRKQIIVAKLTLAQLHYGEDRFTEAIESLTTGQPSVTSAIGEGSEGRPEIGIRSVAFAKIAYTLLIRAHLAAKQLEEARASMTALQQIVGTVDAAALAKLHLELSKEMTASYKQQAADGEEDIELLTTIAASLEQIAANGAELSLASLVKAATTASELADSVTNAEDAQLIYGQAASLYQTILNGESADEKTAKAIRFRLAAAHSKAGSFEESLKLYRELLAEQPNIFTAQFHAASAMQAWGISAKEPNQLARAISGDPENPSIWGWAKLSTTYQRLLAKDQSRDDYRDRFLEARLHIAECRLEYARLLKGSKREMELEKAIRELAILATTSASFEAPGWPKLDTIYQSIQKELGRQPKPLFNSNEKK